jgi:hypothetical protein
VKGEGKERERRGEGEGKERGRSGKAEWKKSESRVKGTGIFKTQVSSEVTF